MIFKTITAILFSSIFVLTAYAESCSATKKECVIPGGTRYFDGVAVKLPCWQYRTTKVCHAHADNNCNILRDKGCMQTGSSCKVKLGDSCLVYDKTFLCPVKKCNISDGIICGGNFFCMNGKCSEHKPTHNKDFSESASQLAAVGSAGNDVKKKNQKHPMIFSGQAMTCKDAPLGFINCCQNKGWGKNIHLAACTQEEQTLGKAKTKDLVVPTNNGDNRYCSHRVLGVCVEHRKSYCAFDSKLAKVVQEQGRKDQLGISFGAARTPNCRGLTPNEMGKIDFSKIDFSEVFKDIIHAMHLPDDDKVIKDIIDKIKHHFDSYDLGREQQND